MQQARSEVRERQHRVDRMACDGQRVLSTVDTAGSPELEEVGRDDLAHPPLVVARLLSPELFFETLEHIAVVPPQLHVLDSRWESAQRSSSAQAGWRGPVIESVDPPAAAVMAGWSPQAPGPPSH